MLNAINNYSARINYIQESGNGVAIISAVRDKNHNHKLKVLSLAEQKKKFGERSFLRRSVPL
jgi:hypothetical protein